MWARCSAQLDLFDDAGPERPREYWAAANTTKRALDKLGACLATRFEYTATKLVARAGFFTRDDGRLDSGAARPFKGKAVRGIYEFSGGRLKVCLDPLYGPRPKKMNSDGRGHVTLTFERLKQKL